MSRFLLKDLCWSTKTEQIKICPDSSYKSPGLISIHLCRVRHVRDRSISRIDLPSCIESALLPCQQTAAFFHTCRLFSLFDVMSAGAGLWSDSKSTAGTVYIEGGRKVISGGRLYVSMGCVFKPAFEMRFR